ncbi:hypothetical protein HanPSC8_Chr01g0044201 [Helianthus annuus]|nr:hypothetical protein HanPSC8_Chr01g0044201 [Helianthus annuus]
MTLTLKEKSRMMRTRMLTRISRKNRGHILATVIKQELARRWRQHREITS